MQKQNDNCTSEWAERYETRTVEPNVNCSIPNMHHRDICATVPYTGSQIKWAAQFHILAIDRDTCTFLPSNSAGPTPTIIMDMGREAACKTEQTHKGLHTWWSDMLWATGETFTTAWTTSHAASLRQIPELYLGQGRLSSSESSVSFSHYTQLQFCLNLLRGPTT